MLTNPTRELPRPARRHLALWLLATAALGSVTCRSAYGAVGDESRAADSATVASQCALAHPPPRPQRTRRVDDRAKFLDPREVPITDSYLQSVHDERGVDIRLMFLTSVPGSLEDFAVRQARALALGCDVDARGVLFVFDVGRRNLRIEVSPNLQSIFTDRFVGYLMRNHLRTIYASNDPTVGVRLTLFMVNTRLRRAALGEEYDPRVADVIDAADQLAAGGGASAEMSGAGDSVPFLNSQPDAADEQEFAPQATIEGAYSRYIEWLQADRFLPNVTLLTRPSREYLSGFPMTRAYKEYILFMEYGVRYEILERGAHGLLYFTSDPLMTPHFFLRTPAGWQMDIAAEVANTQELVGGPYTWRYRGQRDEYTVAFADQLVHIGGFTRLRGGDNRPVPTYRSCVGHARLSPGPVFVSIRYQFTSNVTDPNAASWSEQSLMKSLRFSNPGRYQLASTKPTLPTLMITVMVSSSNGQAPYRANLAVRTSDGASAVVNLSEPTPRDMISALAQRINRFVTLGWICK